jgi:acyl-coenzyme A synthetase/AMP-(fatty) acid ligase
MYSTSGTSGLPKAAVLSHYAMVCQHLGIEPNPSYEVKRLLTLPFFHIFAALFVHILPIRNGQSLYVFPRFQLEQYVEGISKYRITDALMAPPMVHVLNHSSLPLAQMLQTIRYVGVGGAPIDASAMQKFQDKLHPAATLSQVWGMTEIGAAMLHRYPHKGYLASVGRPLLGYEMRLLDAFGNIITADHKPGDLQVRYAGMMTGYKDQEPIPSGSWYSTGDIMYRIDGRYHVVGRSKELIKVNGFQVAPAELEATLLTHPCIIEAAVIGRLRADGVTEVPRAFVVRMSDGGRCSRLTAEEIYAFVAQRLASYKRLDGGIVFVDEIPMTASGKIQRFKLAQMDQFCNSITELRC